MDRWTMTCKKRALRSVLATLAVALLWPVAAAQGQHEKYYAQPQTCQSDLDRLYHGIWQKVQSKFIYAETNSLRAAMDGVMKRRAEAAAIQSHFETYQFLSSLSTTQSSEEAAKAIMEEAGVAASEEVFGEVGGKVVEASLVLSNPTPTNAVQYVYNESVDIGTNIIAIVGLARLKPRYNTLLAFYEVMRAYYRSCRDPQETVDALNIDGGTYNGGPFLTWAIEQWAGENLNTDIYDGIGIHIFDDDLLFYSSSAINEMVDDAKGEISSFADKVVTVSAPEANPAIALVSPGSFVGRPVSQRQRIEITGTGFSQDATLEFYDSSSDCNPCENAN